MSYLSLLAKNKETFPNPNPDEDAGSEDPLLTLKTREPLIFKTLDEYIKMGCPQSSKIDGSIEGSFIRGGWQFYREREDKIEPNFINTAMKTYRSIVNGLSQEAIISVCNSIERPQLIQKGVGQRR